MSEKLDRINLTGNSSLSAVLLYSYLDFCEHLGQEQIHNAAEGLFFGEKPARYFSRLSVNRLFIYYRPLFCTKNLSRRKSCTYF